jgi:DNA-directed RNA polymerase subunit F
MVKDVEVLSMAEVKETLTKYPQSEDNKKAKEVMDYIKKFSKIKPEKAKDIKKALNDLNIIKLKQKHIAKIIDVMPEDAEDVRKIFVGEDVTLDQDEITSILDAVKKNK